MLCCATTVEAVARNKLEIKIARNVLMLLRLAQDLKTSNGVYGLLQKSDGGCELTQTAIKNIQIDKSGLALTRLKAWVYFIDDVNTTFATNHAVGAVTTL